MARKASASGLTKPQEEFAHWLTTTKRERQIHGLPLTQVAWAEWKGLTERTVRRWKQKPEFETFVEQLRIRKARELTPGSTVTAEDVGGARAATDARTQRRLAAPEPASAADDPHAEVTDPRYREYLQMKDALRRAALDGDRSAVAEWFKLYGRDFIEDERRGAERLVDLSDEELVREIIELLGVSTVTEVLAELMTS